MATSYIQKGEVLTYANAGSAISAGDLVVIGVRVGVALEDIAATTGSGQVAMEGVFEVAKQTTLVIAQGDLLYADATSGELDKTASAQTAAGYAFAAELSAATTVKVKLNG